MRESSRINKKSLKINKRVSENQLENIQKLVRESVRIKKKILENQ